jgi:hypothetical protein
MRQQGIIICACFFSVLLLLSSSRFIIFNHYMGKQKETFRQKALLTNAKALSVLRIGKKDLYVDGSGREWKDGNRELLLNGKFHEVVAIKEDGRSVLLYLIEDSRESQLFHEFNNTFGKDDLCGFAQILLQETPFEHTASHLSRLCQESVEYDIAPAAITCEGFPEKACKPPCCSHA